MNKTINYKAEYEKLLEENRLLKERIESLSSRIQNSNEETPSSTIKRTSKSASFQNASIIYNPINKYATPDEKLELYMSLFKGWTDVYAKRWENKRRTNLVIHLFVQMNGCMGSVISLK